jgi:hypothetical protein
MDRLDFLRHVIIGLTVLLIVVLPPAVLRITRPPRVLGLLVCVELSLISDTVALVDHLGEPFRWYQSPILGTASVAGLIYAFNAFKEPLHV